MILRGDILEQEKAGFEPAAADWKLPTLPLSHHTTNLQCFLEWPV